MYLKSIVIHGFKSFANKMKFEFQEGITGIVGPNGSGKSNVADAVRWVLGEQSAKQLRGGNMQDVIFAGTEARKPQSYASVAITFDNSDHKLDIDYEEVTVTRRLYRSGESEYLINNAQVRLRDIHEIFYDTGIGQEGYSIIGQGQIDRILSGKPEERRELFDEAAGIVKFKKRKQASLKKLEAEHQDLVRVNDILQELNSQIGPLKKQSETAKIYLEEKQKQKDLDINLFVIDEERTELQVKEVSERLQIVAGDMTETKEAFDKTKTEYERIEQELEQLDESITELAGRASRNSVLREQLVSQIAVLKEQIHTINISGEQYANRTAQIEHDMEERHAQLAALHEEMQNAEENVRLGAAGETEAVEALAKLDREIERVVFEIERAKQEVIDVLQNRASVKGNMQRFDTMLEQLGIRQAEIGARVLRLKEDEQRASRDFSGHEEEVKQLQDGIREHASAEQGAEKKIAELSEALRTSNEALDRAQTGFHRDSSRLESLRSMAERYDGYGNGIRRIMEQKRRNPGIRGVVADLVDVPEQYETAIETALGGSIRSIVTDNEATAKYMIEFLKAGKLGRATFLPLTSIRGRSLSSREVLKEEGVIGTASSLVSAEEEYSQLVEHLLGRIVVVDTVDHAIQI
ncbi:MAG: chromosome segregation protein SMC, partial [Lachnospiraceae bacterium]|nr:chromosome segregation protein SMC [Lachnospiraceae bacterium]